ncbi:hypothetical protein JCM10207_000103 [Rhodosporidiobolus poonsookiae]
MSNLKSLMAAKKAAARIDAPFAKYDARGALKCSLCGLPVKDALWGAHTISKGHRVNVQKHEAEQAAVAEKKRKREEEADEDDAGGPGKRVKEDAPSRGLPADFFADPSQAPAPAAAEPAEPTQEDDPDWAEFEAYLADGPDPTLPSAGSGARSTATATISAAPVKYEFGAPRVAEEGEAAEEEEEEEQKETDEERVEREMREEREELMARLEEEEREQKEADEKVTVLKRRLEAIRAAKQKKKT